MRPEQKPAVPSLHAAYMVVALVYAIIGKCRWYVITLFAVIMLGIWGTAGKIATRHRGAINITRISFLSLIEISFRGHGQRYPDYPVRIFRCP